MNKFLKKISSTYRTMGIGGLFAKTFAYFTNWRVRREDIIWFICRLFKDQYGPKTRVHGFKCYVRSQDPGISRELAVYHTHEPSATQLFKKYIQEGMYEIDIGSNLGYYALLASKCTGPRGKVIAIEPEPNNFDLLKINVETNRIENVTVLPYAIGDENGTSKFFVTEASNTNSLLQPALGNVMASIHVQVRKLDTLYEELNIPRIDLVRMDIEGGEIIAIKGMSRVLKQYKPMLLIELHCDTAGVDNIKKLLKSLVSYGYTAQYLVDRDRDFAWKTEECVLKLASMDQLLEILGDYRVVTVLFT